MTPSELGWRPIETAPPGDPVLLSGVGNDGKRWVVLGYLDDRLGGWWEGERHWTEANDQPTHWMALPAPPLASTSSDPT